MPLNRLVEEESAPGAVGLDDLSKLHPETSIPRQATAARSRDVMIALLG
jgi:hypothetical protein